MTSQSCKRPMSSELTAPIQVLKGVRDACSHCRDFQCSPGLCYAGPCPQGAIDSNLNPTCLSTDYCWNPAPVTVKGQLYKMCFQRTSDGGHGLSITGGKVILDKTLSMPMPNYQDRGTPVPTDVANAMYRPVAGGMVSPPPGQQYAENPIPVGTNCCYSSDYCGTFINSS